MQRIGSEILTSKHTAALLRLFDRQRPRMTLLFSGKRDGMTATNFHSHCDGKGPTFTVVRTRMQNGAAGSGQIIGGWAAESWNSSGQQYPGETFLFGLGSVAAATSPVVSKYRALPSTVATAMYGVSSCGPAFGSGGYGMAITMQQAGGGGGSTLSSAQLRGWEIVEGFEPVMGPLGGAATFEAESVEVWSCPLMTNTTAAAAAAAAATRAKKGVAMKM